MMMYKHVPCRGSSKTEGCDEELACDFEEEKDFGTRGVNRCGQCSKQEGQEEPGQAGQESGLYSKCNRKLLQLWAGK